MLNKHKKNKKQRIGIDARLFGPRQKGLGRYAQKLVEYLEEVDGGSSEREYFIFLRKDNLDLYHPQHSNFHKVEAEFAWYGFKEQLIYPFFLRRFKLDLMHFTHFNVPLFYKGKFLVTIHDLILFHYPTVRNTTRSKWFYFFKLLAYRMVISWAVKRAGKVIAVSDFTKQDIAKTLKVSKEKIVRIYEGCGLEKFYQEKRPEGGNKKAQDFIRKILKKYAIMKPYLLYVGNAYPHKNLERLVTAFGYLKRKLPDLNLVLVGEEDFFYRRLTEFTREKKEQGVIFAGFVPDNELEVFYQEASLYVFPSLYEGFGIPPLEALRRGLPVISSPETSMKEVLGELADYFNPRSAKEMSGRIEAVLKKKRIVGRKKVFELEEKFSWRKMTRETKKIYVSFLK